MHPHRISARFILALCAVLASVGFWPSGAAAESSLQTVPAGPPSFAAVAERVTPAVVNVTVVQNTQARGSLTDLLPPGLENTPLHEFFRRFHGEVFSPPRTGQGSGFIIDPAGYIVTNNHVVEGADRIEITLIDGAKYNARLIGRDTKTDLALLKIDAKGPLPAVALGSAENARVGDWVLAVGNPFGLGSSVSAGIISARGRDIRSGPYDDYLQIDAAINRGNSGGPLFDASGKVIGVNTAIYSPTGGNVGIGFAIPAETVAEVVAELRKKGRVERGWLGVQIQPVTEEVAASLGLSEAAGVLVADVLDPGPAKAAGLRAGDVIVRLAGEKIADYRQLTRRVAALSAGTKVDVEVIREGRPLRVTVEIGRMPNDDEPLAAAPATGDHTPARLGLSLAALTPELRARYNVAPGSTGVLVTQVAPGSPAARAGIRAGMVISMVGQQTVSTPEEVIAAISAAAAHNRPAVLLRIEHEGEQRFVAVPLAG